MRSSLHPQVVGKVTWWREEYERAGTKLPGAGRAKSSALLGLSLSKLHPTLRARHTVDT